MEAINGIIRRILQVEETMDNIHINTEKQSKNHK